MRRHHHTQNVVNSTAGTVSVIAFARLAARFRLARPHLQGELDMELSAYLRRAVVAGFAVLALLPLSASAADLPDPKPRIAVVSAFEPEWVVLKAELTESIEHNVNG